MHFAEMVIAAGCCCAIPRLLQALLRRIYPERMRRYLISRNERRAIYNSIMHMEQRYQEVSGQFVTVGELMSGFDVRLRQMEKATPVATSQPSRQAL